MLFLASPGLFTLRKTSLSMVPTRSRLSLPHRCARHLSPKCGWQDGLDRAGRLSADATWRQYVNSFRYTAPTALANARSLVIMALPLKIARIAFHMGGKKRDILIPCGYVDDGHSLDDLQGMLYNEGIVAAG